MGDFLDFYFYWLGVASAVLFAMLGITVCSAWVMDAIWRKYKDGFALWEMSIALTDYRTTHGPLSTDEPKEGAPDA